MTIKAFKEDFFPGERVTVILDDGEKAVGVIRDKASFPKIVRPDGSIEREAMSRYLVRVPQLNPGEVLVDNKQIFRDRRAFSKQVLRSFLKNTLYRESWSGAPWIVKYEIAQIYHIDTAIPLRLQQESITAEKKAMAALKKEGQGKNFQY